MLYKAWLYVCKYKLLKKLYYVLKTVPCINKLDNQSSISIWFQTFALLSGTLNVFFSLASIKCKSSKVELFNSEENEFPIKKIVSFLTHKKV